MRILVGSTGFVGSTLAQQAPFDLAVHRPNLDQIRGVVADEVICAGLPATKFASNANPEADWANTVRVAGALAEVEARELVLISTIDVYQPPAEVTELSPPAYDGAEAYGRNRAWFEAFVRAHFDRHLTIRLPGLFGLGLRKNLVFDLLEGRDDQWANVNAKSTFQFFDSDRTWEYINRARAAGITLLNIATQPISAQEIADLFSVTLGIESREVHYDVRTRHDQVLNGSDGYLVSAREQLAGIEKLRLAWGKGGDIR